MSEDDLPKDVSAILELDRKFLAEYQA